VHQSLDIMSTKGYMSNKNRTKRSAIARAFIGLIWFILVNVLFIFTFAEIISWYVNSSASGQNAIDLDRALSKKFGGTIGVFFFLVSAILTIRWSISGFLPGTSNAEKNDFLEIQKHNKAPK
jgi:hypothetical protein